MKPIATTLPMLLIATVLAATADAAGSLADRALDACRQAGTVGGTVRETRLHEGVALAEAALAGDPRDARAHLAFFCNQGRLVQDAGVGLSALAEVRRLTRIIDDAARLAPNDPDILTARGAFLLELPRLLGGDPDTGETLLRRSLALAPSNCEAASYLARALEARGRRDEAVALLGSC